MHVPKTFRQAVAFPVLGTAPADIVLSIPGVAPCLMIELETGLLIGMRLVDSGRARLSISAFLRNIERTLERLPQGISAWPSIERAIAMMTCQQVRLVNYSLEANAARFWKEIYPRGTAIITEALFCGMPPVPNVGKMQATEALRDIQSVHYCAAIAQFINCLDNEIVQAIHACRAPTLAEYNSYLRGATNAARNRKQAAQTIPLLAHLFSENTLRVLPACNALSMMANRCGQRSPIPWASRKRWCVGCVEKL